MKTESENHAEKREIDRRDFCKKSLLAIAGVAGASWLLESCAKSNSSTPAPAGPSVNFTIDLSTAQYSGLLTKGNYAYVNNTIIARDSSGNYIALYDVCTHAGCTIAFNGTNQFPCPCHGSIFDESGNAVQGPASAPVKKYTCTLSGTKLTVAG
jgi:cytochrome b6-f complex iron-sulfur subunit